MSFFYNYFSKFLFQQSNTENIDESKNNNTIVDDEIYIIKHLVSLNDLKSVHLTPVKDIIPNPSRNMPPLFDKIDLRNLNKAQLTQILNVKLKHVPLEEQKREYKPRHPVLRELLDKFRYTSNNNIS